MRRNYKKSWLVASRLSFVAIIMKKIKVIALDVDGTITFKDKTLDIQGYKAILKAAKKGLIVILTSGIPVQGLRPLASLMGASPYLIGENGGVIFNGEELEVLSNPENAKKCFEELQQKIRGIEIYSKADTRLSEVCLKLGPNVNEIEKIASKYGLRVVPTGFAIHLVQPNINKGSALKKLSSELGYTMEECAAVGDSRNDIEMVRDSGLGIGVQNARPEVKAVAKHITKKAHGAGVMEAVDYILKHNRQFDHKQK